MNGPRELVQSLVTARAHGDEALVDRLLDEAVVNPRPVMHLMIDWLEGVIARADPVVANRDSMATYLADNVAATVRSAAQTLGRSSADFMRTLQTANRADTDGPISIAGDLIAARVVGGDPAEPLARALGVGMTDVLAGLVAWLRWVYDLLARRMEERGLIDFLLGSIDEVLDSVTVFTKVPKTEVVAGMWLTVALGEPSADDE